VLGDSFAYGHDLHDEDSFIYKLQIKLQKKACRISFVNLAKRGVNSTKCLEIYQQFKDAIPHDAVLYGLHLNDRVEFATSYIVTNPLAIPEIVKWSKGLDFVTK
jgi:hypothetical protein